jgi:hypothetical protein
MDIDVETTIAEIMAEIPGRGPPRGLRDRGV